jgi:peptidoglycan/LPS O-acetylase OafA/YrhL
MKFLQAYLQRVTSSGRFIPQVDGLRFLAIMPVVLFHIAGRYENHGGPEVASQLDRWLVTTIGAGAWGVPLFFVISGFILGLPFALHYLGGEAPVNLRSYFMRRLTRLEPPYMLNMVVLFFVMAHVTHEGTGGLFPHLLSSLTYTHNVVYKEMSAINYVAWSLEIEVQFYLVAPLLAYVFRVSDRVRRRGILVFGCLAAILIQTLVTGPAKFPITLISYIQFFLMGFLVADLYVTDWGRAPKTGIAWDLAAACAVVVVFVMAAQARPGALVNALLPISILALVIGAFRGRNASRLLSVSWLTVIGGMCYTIYLWHSQIVSTAGRLTDSIQVKSSYALTLIAQSLLLVPVVLVICAALFLLVERPCMRKDWPARTMAATKRAYMRLTTSLRSKESVEPR